MGALSDLPPTGYDGLGSLTAPLPTLYLRAVPIYQPSATAVGIAGSSSWEVVQSGGLDGIMMAAKKEENGGNALYNVGVYRTGSEEEEEAGGCQWIAPLRMKGRETRSKWTLARVKMVMEKEDS